MIIRAGQPEKGSQDRTARTGQPEKNSQHCQDRTPMQDCQDRTARDIIAEGFWPLEPGCECYAAKGGKNANSRFIWRFRFFRIVSSSRSRALFGSALASPNAREKKTLAPLVIGAAIFRTWVYSPLGKRYNEKMVSYIFY
jgi:hypothetical protein